MAGQNRLPFRQQLYFAVIALLLVPWVLSFVPALMVYKEFGLINTYWALTVPRIVNGSTFGIFLLRTFFAGYAIASFPLAVLLFALGKFYAEGLVESGLKV